MALDIKLRDATIFARLILTSFIPILFTGCDLLGIKEASRSVSELADTIDHAKNGMSADARHIENTFKEVIDDLKKTQHELLVRDFQSAMDHAIQNVGAEGRCSIDYTFRKLQGQLELVRRAIMRADAEIKLEKYERKAELNDYLKRLRVDEYYPPPEVCTCTPTTIDLLYDKYTEKTKLIKPSIISFSGFGFEAYNLKKADFAFFLDDSTEEATANSWRRSARQVIPRVLVTKTDKTVDVDLSGIEFKRGDRRLIVVCDDPDLHPRSRRQLTAFIINVTEQDGIPKPTDWAAIGWRVEFVTNRHKKEEAGLFNLKLILPNYTASQNNLGINDFWKDPSAKEFPGGKKNYVFPNPIVAPGKTLVRFQVALRPRPGDKNIDWGGTVHFTIVEQRTVYTIVNGKGKSTTEFRQLTFSTKSLYFNAEKVTEPAEQKGNDQYEIEVLIPD